MKTDVYRLYPDTVQKTVWTQPEDSGVRIGKCGRGLSKCTVHVDAASGCE